MSFGRNPHVPKAEAAEQKAADADDDLARSLAYRDAARQWERAADREKPGAKRSEYERHAERNRALADGEAVPDDEADAPPPAASPTPPKFLN